jgi:hypothetical protein
MKVWELLHSCDIEDVAEISSLCVPEWKYSSMSGIESLLTEMLSCTVAIGPSGGPSGTLKTETPDDHSFLPKLCWTDNESKGPSGQSICRSTMGLYWSDWLGLDIDDHLLWSYGQSRLAFIILWNMDSFGVNA